MSGLGGVVFVLIVPIGYSMTTLRPKGRNKVKTRYVQYDDKTQTKKGGRAHKRVKQKGLRWIRDMGPHGLPIKGTPDQCGETGCLHQTWSGRTNWWVPGVCCGVRPHTHSKAPPD